MTNMSRREFFARVGFGAAASLAAGRIGVQLLANDQVGASSLDLGTFSRQISLRPNRHPALFTFTPDRTRCLVACQETNSVAVVDRQSNSLVSSIAISKGTVPWAVECMA